MIEIMFVLFDSLSDLEARERMLAEGEHLFRVKDPIRSMFLVTAGEVRLVRQLPHGPALTMQVAGEGSVLAEASLFATEYHCDAIAATATRVLVVPRVEVERAVTRDPKAARAWSRHLAQEIQRARAQVEIVSLKTVAERLDAWATLRGCEPPPKGEWRKLASELSVTPEALYRELARRRHT